MKQKKAYKYKTKKFYNITQEIKDYFKNKEKEYLEFDDHPLSSTSDLMDPSKPAPWDHLTNTEDDEDIDIDIQEYIKK
ncbi:MAG: hypothetical protein CBD16_03360, partial [Betaproteobacteria bacterium TMED156]|tara:strand:+ start:244 stop:477 length:234 start_codon:yes stop_codon:yes gene_type:complete